MADDTTPVSQSANSQSKFSKPPSSQTPSFELPSSESSSSKSSYPKTLSSEPPFFQFPSQACSAIDPPIAPILAEIARVHPDQLWDAAVAYHCCPKTEKPEGKPPRWTCWGLRQIVSGWTGMFGIIVTCLVTVAFFGWIFVYVPVTEDSHRHVAKSTVSSSSVPSLNSTASVSRPGTTTVPALVKHERRSPSSLTNLTSPATSAPVASTIPSLLPASRSSASKIRATNTPVRSILHGSQQLSSSLAFRTGVLSWSESTFRILPIPTGHKPNTTFATRPLRTTQSAMRTPDTTSLKTLMTIDTTSTQI